MVTTKPPLLAIRSFRAVLVRYYFHGVILTPRAVFVRSGFGPSWLSPSSQLLQEGRGMISARAGAGWVVNACVGRLG
jgi:hypothetical protein